MTPNQKNELGTKFWLTGLANLKSAPVLSNGGKSGYVL